ncbi:MAG: ABC transporter permease [Saprospiraceae bacterium]|nr:ABC transporter permease [Saprospiraceae bacterium]
MTKSYLLTALRNLWRRKGMSALNLFGLTLGITIFLLIAQYASFELSYDRHYPQSDLIYRVGLEQYQNGELVQASAENYPALGPALLRDFPEVNAFARLYNLGAKNNIVVTYETPGQKIAFKQKRLLYATDSFLDLFGYQMVAGDRSRALEEPFKMVISQSTASKYFGDSNPIGKYLRMQDDDFNDELCEVTGVVRDVPANSHLKFDVLISYTTLYSRYNGSPRARARYDESWERKDMYTYVKLQEGADARRVADRFPALIRQYVPNLEEQNREEHLILQPVTDIHLYSSLNNEPEINGNGRTVYFLGLIAVFVLIIAYINYINLATARSIERANEVGVRKVLGADRQQLMIQFLLESFLINGSALLFATGLYLVLFSGFSRMVTNLEDQQFWNFALWHHSWFLPFLAALLFGGTLLSGLYPAFVLSRFRPIRILGNSMPTGRAGHLLRKGLVLFQFAICVALIVGTMVVYRQMDYMINQDLGFNDHQIIVVEQPGVAENFESRTRNIKNFKTEVARNASISDVMSTLVIPGRKIRWKINVRRIQDEPEKAHVFNYNLVDANFIPGFGMQLEAGRNFSEDIPSDRDTACIITRNAVELLGFKNPEEAIGQVITSDDIQQTAIIVGVVNDYHQESLVHEMQPTLLLLNDYAEFYLMRANTSNLKQTIAFVEDTWNDRFPGSPFQYFFLDDYFNAQYQNEIRFQKLFLIFAFLAILVACMGLFGLSAFMAQQRVKEVSVRKVLGAGITQLVWLLTTDFARIILLANFIAWPVIGYLMHRWLQGFATRIDLSAWYFLVAGVLVLVLGAATVLFHALRAASTNPATILSAE